MKRIVFYVLVFIGFSFSQTPGLAQTEKGKFLVGNGYSVSITSAKTTNFAGTSNSYLYKKKKSTIIEPETGYFILNNLALGIQFLYNYQKESTFFTNGTTPQDYDYERISALIPFFIYYVGKNQIKPYLTAGIGPGWRKSGYSIFREPEITQKNKLLTSGYGGGIAVFINKNVSVDFGMTYNKSTIFYKEELQGGNYNEWKNVTSGTNITFGIIVCI